MIACPAPPIALAHCSGCGRCVAACPRRALSLSSAAADGRGRKRATAHPAHCARCGACQAACPRQALIAPARPDPHDPLILPPCGIPSQEVPR